MDEDVQKALLVERVLADDLCRRKGHDGLLCQNLAEDPHTCPYGEEINDDHSTCTCCQTCTDQCADDI